MSLENRSEPKILSNQAELDNKDRPLFEMQDWCLRQGDLVVLKSGLILTTNLHSRSVQNCKIILSQKNLISPKNIKVIQASQSLIDVLLADAQASVDYGSSLKDYAVVSSQQQRLRALVKEALNVSASDIHIEVRNEIARIRFRKHGELYLYAEWQAVLGREIASVAFNKETDHAITHFNPHVPQNASMPLEVDGVHIRLRLASVPAHGGFDMVMRVLTSGDDKHSYTLEDLGYLPDQINIIQRAANMPSGAVIISGPTGSGKTTTLASCMNLIDSRRKIYSIEDPVEKIIPHATQIPVNTEKEDRDFAMMGKAALRMDPDVMILGEMRDEETARVMLRASMTGHLVFSTLHTNSATAIVTRLVDMGISRVLLSDPQLLVCLVCQRLLPLLCKVCKTALPNTPYFVRNKTNKCVTCQGSGVSQRTVVAEIIWVDDEGRRFIQNGDMLGWDHYLRAQSWQSYADRALDLAKAGLSCPYDVQKLTGVTLNI